jgi:hypothetical protein
MTTGTDLCHPEDAEMLERRLPPATH